MSKPDFKAMSWKELHALDTWVEMPPVRSPEELDNYPEFLEHIRRSAEPRDKTI
jgi:hypothetical protein